MPGLLGTRAPIESDLSLILQIIAFVMLLVGFRLGKIKTKEGLRRHGILMRTMVVLHVMGVATVMIPKFVEGFAAVVNEPAKIGFPLISLHAVLSSIAVFLGIVLAFRKFGKVRTWMRITFLVWFVTLLLGFSIYVGYYILSFPI